ELDYLSGDIAATAHVLRRRLASLPPTEILHCHNPTLGKNPALTLALYEEAKRGRGILYHCHDFAEDRPDNYNRLKKTLATGTGRNLREILYPAAPQCRFGGINRSDCRRLAEYGVPPEQIDYLPNPVPPATPVDDATATARLRLELGVGSSQQLWLYPVRAIPRKNIGEFLLLLALFRQETVGAITLPPNNPVDFPAYEQWRRFAAEQQLPVRFGVGDHQRLPELFAAADLCLSTSVREGFGMTFVQPWQYGKPVAGRRLPSIFTDFTAAGMVLPQFYDRLDLPGETRDFAALPPDEQRIWIDRVRDPAAAAAVLELNPVVTRLTRPGDPALIAGNRTAIRRNFSITAYGRILYAAYQQIIGRLP
ncbi:MAG: glycosyltransferase family 4 protein, partial [Victivallales bacterium]|nr:glycosyltransferase family 4 protein [Victivallales bacterium]